MAISFKVGQATEVASGTSVTLTITPTGNAGAIGLSHPRVWRINAHYLGGATDATAIKFSIQLRDGTTLVIRRPVATTPPQHVEVVFDPGIYLKDAAASTIIAAVVKAADAAAVAATNFGLYAVYTEE